MNSVFLTSISNDFDKELARFFAENSWKVFYGEGESEFAEKADLSDRDKSFGKQCEKLDLYIDTIRCILPEDNKEVRDGLDREVILKSFRENYLKPIHMLESVLPIMDKCDGALEAFSKRLVFINTAESSVNWNMNKSGYGYSMARAALNNTVSTMYNKLFPLGYTFRMYDPMYVKVSAKAAAAGAYVYILRGRCDDDGDPRCQDERRLVIRDALAREIPW